MIALALALALTGQAEDPQAAGPAAPQATTSQTSSAWSATDEEINRGLVSAWRSNPQRRVCAQWTPTGTSVPRAICGTLDEFFRQRSRAEVAQNRAPFRLIDEVKRQRALARTQSSQG